MSIRLNNILSFDHVSHGPRQLLSLSIQILLCAVLFLWSPQYAAAQKAPPTHDTAQRIPSLGLSDPQYRVKFLSLKDAEGMQYSEKHNVYYRGVAYPIDSLHKQYEYTPPSPLDIELDKRFYFSTRVQYKKDTIYIKDPYLNHILDITGYVTYEIVLDHGRHLNIRVPQLGKKKNTPLTDAQQQRALLYFFGDRTEGEIIPDSD